MQGTAIVTGSAGDIGRAITERLVSDGYAVEGWDRDEQGQARNDADLAGKAYVSRTVDLLDADGVGAAGSADRPAPVRLLVNNAGGVTESVTLKGSNEADLQQDLDLNLMAAWRCMQQFQNSLKNGGAIVNIASINGTGVYGFPGYSAAKAGLIHLTRFAAVELGKDGIRVNAIAPGTVRTKAWDSRLANDPEIFDNLAKWYPMKDVCWPSDIAAAASFLASSDARMITGVMLPVDGGLSAGVDIIAGDICQIDF